MFSLARYVVVTSAGALLLSACAVRQGQGDMPPIGAQGARPNKVAWSHQVMYDFDLQPRNDGSGEPYGGLLNVNGTLYGTTYAGKGGLSARKCREADYHSCGTVYTLSTTGEYKTLYAFHGGKRDGALPGAGLIDVNGTLYGTTEYGGSGCKTLFFSGCGTVYSISTTGTEKVLYSFTGGPDGANPTQGDLLYMNGTLYGTTSRGGSTGCYSAEGCGTVYSITTSGQEKVLHSFGSGNDGAQPQWGLINVHGTMYGTTLAGGAHLCGTVVTRGCGTVFSISASGAENVLYSFAGGSDGTAPDGGLLDVKGTLYGTTVIGGADADCGGSDPGCGTVYSVTTAGREKVLYRFRGNSDGLNPIGPLIDIKSKLYGTTTGYVAIAQLKEGGTQRVLDSCGTSCGTFFSVTTTGTEKVLYTFTGGADGSQPDAPLINVSGTLYSTTHDGGKGWGTVFSLAP